MDTAAHHRGADRSIPSHCPSCGKELPKVVELDDGGPERTVELKCSCGHEIRYVGPGLIVDRRKAR
jgi:hypothetical protein